jgi:ketosteroid isomerase-like protein
MSSANVDLVRAIYAGWERGDFFGSADWAHPEIEFVRTEAPENPSPSKGLAGMADSARDFLSAWEDYRAEAVEYRELDDERVLVLVRQSGRGKTSGLDVGQLGVPGATLFHIRGGKVTRLVLYWDRARALADLGLSSEAEAP